MPRLEIELQNGTTHQVEFDSMPSDDDIDHVAKHLSSIQPSIGQDFEQPTTFDTVKGSLYEPDSIGYSASNLGSANQIVNNIPQQQRRVVQQSNVTYPVQQMDMSTQRFHDLSQIKPIEFNPSLGGNVQPEWQDAGYDLPSASKTGNGNLQFNLSATKNHYLDGYEVPVNELDFDFYNQADKNWNNIVNPQNNIESYDDNVYDDGVKFNYQDAPDYNFDKQAQYNKEEQDRFKAIEAFNKLLGEDNSAINKLGKYAGTLGQSIRKGIHGLRKGFYSSLENAGSFFNNKSLYNFGLKKSIEADARQSAIQQYNGRVADVVNLVGETAPITAIAMGTGLAIAPVIASAGIVGAPAFLLSAGAMYAANSPFMNEYFDHQRTLEQQLGRALTTEERKSLSNIEAINASVQAGLESLADRIGLGIFIDGLNKLGFKVAKNATRKEILSQFAKVSTDVFLDVGVQAVDEGATEALQEGTLILTEGALGINEGDNYERIKKAASGGAIVGGLFGGAASVAGRSGSNVTNADGGITGERLSEPIIPHEGGTGFTLPGYNTETNTEDVELQDALRRTFSRVPQNQEQNKSERPADFQYPALANQFEQQTSLEPPQSSGIPVEQQTGQNTPNNTETLQNEQSDMSETDEQPKRKRGGKTRAEMQAN